MKYVMCVMAAMLMTGCAQLASPPVATAATVKDANQHLMTVNCSGLADTWGECYSAAGKSCANGYEVVDKLESPRGATRILDFRCK